MRIVSNIAELKSNLTVLSEYLASKVDPEYSFALGLVKRGTCFVAISDNGRYYFYPSRFIGYVKNSMDAHLANSDKSGLETNPAISQILGSKPQPNQALDKLYREFCENLGFVANEKGSFGVERKFWEWPDH